MKTKTCNKCNTRKPLDENNFPKNKRYRGGFSTWCTACHNQASTRSRKKLFSEDPNYHKNNAMRKHHWTPEQYSAKLKEQGGHCALCPATSSKGERLSVDHNHEICPGKYACDKCRRGLLCSACNANLGYLEQTLRESSVNPQPNTWTARAIAYLKSYEPKPYNWTEEATLWARLMVEHPRSGIYISNVQVPSVL